MRKGIIFLCCHFSPVFWSSFNWLKLLMTFFQVQCHWINIQWMFSASYWGAVFNWLIVHMAGNATGRISPHQKLLLVEHLRSEASNWIDRVLMDVQRKSPSYLNIHRSVACREIQSKPVHNNSSSEFLLSASHYSRYSLGATMPPAFLLSAPPNGRYLVPEEQNEKTNFPSSHSFGRGRWPKACMTE